MNQKNPNTEPTLTLYERTLLDNHVSYTTPRMMPVGEQGLLRYLERLEAAQQPMDLTLFVKHATVKFANKRMWVTFDGVPGFAGMLVTNTGSHHMAREVLPSRFFSGLKKLVKLDEDLATQVWDRFSRTRRKERMFRTVRTKLPNGKVYRAVRSVHSDKYAPFSNKDFIAQLAGAPEYAELPLLHVTITDNHFRTRFAALDAPTSALRAWDASGLGSEPVPMVEAWNSETGSRAVGLKAGAWWLDESRGLPHWSARNEFRWIHRGDPNRIRGGAAAAYETLLTASAEVVEAWQEAQDVPVEDIALWTKQQLQKRGHSQETQSSVAKLLETDRVSEGETLASAVDAMTLHAAKNSLAASEELSQSASFILRDGLNTHRKGGNLEPDEEEA